MQASSMWYAYFRFYIDEGVIRDGLNQYCTEWENMQGIGYNYKEYKCYVDNPGGLEHWVGDMGGYISDRRETGFMDGSPSDGVYDTSLLMGSERVNDSDFLTLLAVPQGKIIYFRKITAQDNGIAHKISLTDGLSKIIHPVAYVFDSTQMEVLKPSGLLVDSSDVDSYEFTADISVSFIKGGVQDSLSGGTAANFANAVDRDPDTRCTIDGGGGIGWWHLVIDMEEEFNAISINWDNYYVPDTHKTTSIIAISKDKVSWTDIGASGYVNIRQTVGDNNVDARYVRVSLRSGTTDRAARCYLHSIFCSK